MSEGAAVFGLVLAGGQSRRMGTDKALLLNDGETQLARAVRLLEEHTRGAFVSTSKNQADDAERRKYPQIVDRYTDIGPIAGILSALDSDPESTWLVLACDLPNIDGRTIRYLLDSSSGQQPFTAFRSSYDGLPEPLCALYRPAAREIIRKFVEAGTICPRKILINSDTELLEQPDPGALDNINTPEDLKKSRMKVAS